MKQGLKGLEDMSTSTQGVETNAPLFSLFAKKILIKCSHCKELLYIPDLARNHNICQRCNHYFQLTAYERIHLLVDPMSFVETDADLISLDPLTFKSRSHAYAEKLLNERKDVGLNAAVITGHACIDGNQLALAVMDFRFIGGSMGSAVGEKITRMIEYGIQQHIPVLIVSASGGARMQEGMYALLQMAKTTLALNRLGRTELPYFSLLTHPTTGGVTASFAMLGDVILAEPGSMICFAGPRVIEQFLHTDLPNDAITAEAAFRHGMIDNIVQRTEMRSTLARLLRIYSKGGIRSKRTLFE